MADLELARKVLRTEAAAILALVERLDGRFSCAVELLRQCRGRVILTGMGKSGIICRKIAATLSSTGTPSFFLHPAEAIHGDLGVIQGNDVIVARLDGSAARAREGVERVSGVHSVEASGDELVITAADGAAAIGAVAVALDTVATVRNLALRTPTLDDVFLELTGNHIETDEPATNQSQANELVEVGQ